MMRIEGKAIVLNMTYIQESHFRTKTIVKNVANDYL